MAVGIDVKVSIVIPVYNGSNYLADAIDSALAQTYKNLEVIVVNDGSSDNGATRKVAERYIGRIRYFEKSNGGVASALNFGIAQMKGDYFSWLSHDDLYSPQKIEIQMKSLAAFAHDRRGVIVYGNCAVFSLEVLQAKVVCAPDAGLRYFRYLLATSSAIHGCTLLIPREAFAGRSFDEDLPTTQDYDMWFRLAGDYWFLKVNETLVFARQHPGQDSVKKRRLAREEKNKLCSTFVKQLDVNDIDPATGMTPMHAYQRVAAHYAKSGLASPALAAIKKAFSCVRSSGTPGMIGVSLMLALVFFLQIPLGLARVWGGDLVRR